MDYVQAQFPFGSLSEGVRETILSGNEPQYSFICYKGYNLRFAERGDEPMLPELETVMIVDLRENKADCVLPTWLQGAEVEVTLEDRFFGYLDNGIFRYGNVKATVSTKTEMVDPVYDQSVATTITITGHGQAKQVLDQAIKLYRLVRTNNLEEKHVVERWPVKVPEGMSWVVLGQGKQAERVG